MIVESEIVTRCILCNGTRLRPLALTLRPGLPHFCRVRCRDCGLVISSPMASQETLNRYYADYFTTGCHADQTCGETYERRLRAGQRAVREIQEYVRAGRFLDVGCGAGHVCKAAEDSGFESHGVDLSESGIEFAKRHFGLKRVACGQLADVGFAAGMFDVVHCWHLLEHVRDPVALIGEIRRILVPGGYLYWGTDNHRSSGYTLLRLFSFLTMRFPPIYDGIEHTYGFNPATIGRLLEAHGFRSLSVRTYPDPFRAGEILRDARETGIGKAVRTFAQSVFRIKMRGVAQRKA